MTKKEVIKIYSELRLNKRRCIETELSKKQQIETRKLQDQQNKEVAPLSKEIEKIHAKYMPEFEKIRVKYSIHDRCPDTMNPVLAKFDAETNKKIMEYANDISHILTE